MQTLNGNKRQENSYNIVFENGTQLDVVNAYPRRFIPTKWRCARQTRVKLVHAALFRLSATVGTGMNTLLQTVAPERI